MSFKLQKINNNNKIESFKSVDLALDHSGSLSSYISYVNSIPLLSSDEEYNLAKDYKENGNKDSCHKIVLSHLRVVVSIAAKLSRKTIVDIGDLISEGNYALMHAADKFDYKKGGIRIIFHNFDQFFENILFDYDMFLKFFLALYI